MGNEKRMLNGSSQALGDVIEALKKKKPGGVKSDRGFGTWRIEEETTCFLR